MRHRLRRAIAAGIGAGGGLAAWMSAAMAQGLGATETSVHGGTLVIITYLVLWGLFLGVLVLAVMRQKKLQAEIDGLERRIDEVLGAGQSDDL